MSEKKSLNGVYITPEKEFNNYIKFFNDSNGIDISTPKCNKENCKCLLQQINNNIFIHSPTSIEKYLESYNRKLIKIEKIVDNKNKESSNDISEKIEIENDMNIINSSKYPKRSRFGSYSSIKKRILISPESKKKDLDNNSTFCSSQKKLKRLKKSKRQIDMLKKMYEECSEWNKDIINIISEKSNLSHSVIYKWFWDQKNKNNNETD